jgi:hypothetical protein
VESEDQCIICRKLVGKDSTYKPTDPSMIMYIEPIEDSALRRLIGRDQHKTYLLCSKHMRVIDRMIEDYSAGLYKPSRG